MKPGIASVKIGNLRLLDRFYHILRNELERMRYPCQMLGRVEDKGGARSKKRTRLGTDYGAVLQFYRC